MSTTSRPSMLFSLSALIFCCSTSSWGQARLHKPDTCLDSKRGLHATLNAESGYYGDPRLETLTFRLMNDSDQVLDSATTSWTLVIDDREVPDRGGQLWMGPQPTTGYGTVRSGSTFQFGKALPIREYFPEARDYKIYWKAAAFRSNVAVVRGGATP
jgi:hypothetical protein